VHPSSALFYQKKSRNDNDYDVEVKFMTDETTLFERFGGASTLAKLVDIFYDNVALDPELAPIFPDDLTETKAKQYKFLTQFFGGPPLYMREYGHPMLRARHMRFEVTPTRAKAWLACMHAALQQVDISDDVREEMYARLTFTAQHMVNTADEDRQE
jgi:hemoglobin